MKKLVVSFLALGLVGAAWVFAQPAAVPTFINANPPFTITIKPQKNTFKVGETVRIDIAIRNISNRRLPLRETYPELDYRLVVVQTNGISAPYTNIGRRLRNGDRLFDTLHAVDIYRDPGEEFVERDVRASFLYDMSHPGEYVIQVQKEIPEQFGGGSAVSNSVKVTMTN